MAAIKPKKQNLTEREIKTLTKRIRDYLKSNRDWDGHISISRFIHDDGARLSISFTRNDDL